MGRIEDIVTHTQRRVKGTSDKDNQEFSNHLNNTNENWIDSWLSNPPDLITHSNFKPETELDKSKRLIERRINHGDFRDRFSDKQVKEAEQQRQVWFEKILADTLETYTLCLYLVE